MIHFTSDLHLFHGRAMDTRSLDSVEAMNNWLILMHNKRVAPTDDVYYLGDLSFGKEPETHELLATMNGRKHLVTGNHDHMFRKHADRWPEFVWIRPYADLKRKEVLAHFKRINQPCPVPESELPSVFALHHYAQRVWRDSHHGSIHLFGHSHGTMPPFGRSLDVGVDCSEITTELRPVSLVEVMAYMQGRTTPPTDYHVARQ